MKRQFRLKRTTDFKRVRRLGRSYAHPLMVLIKHPNEISYSRFGIVVGGKLGNAVQRNRIKRYLREAVRLILAKISPGWDIILLARKPIGKAAFDEIIAEVSHLVERAELLNEQDVN